jgi:hypothetical protein
MDFISTEYSYVPVSYSAVTQLYTKESSAIITLEVHNEQIPHVRSH